MLEIWKGAEAGRWPWVDLERSLERRERSVNVRAAQSL